MKTVYFVRHGESEGNAGNKFQSAVEKLTEVGIQQAEYVAKRFASIPIDVILASTMLRAYHTAQKIAELTNKKLVVNDVLVEVSRPTSLHGQTKNDPEIEAIDAELMRKFGNAEWKHSDEENFYDLQKRAQKAIAMILERPEENICVVTHGFFLRMMFAEMMFGADLTPVTFLHMNRVMKTFNTGITKIRHEKNMWILLAWNDHAHLG